MGKILGILIAFNWNAMQQHFVIVILWLYANKNINVNMIAPTL